VSLADLGGGIYATAGILAALHQRHATGLGAKLHIAMFDVLVEWMTPLLLAFTEGGVEIEPAGTRHATITPYGPFPTASGPPVNIAVQNERQWVALCPTAHRRSRHRRRPVGDARRSTGAGRTPPVGRRGPVDRGRAARRRTGAGPRFTLPLRIGSPIRRGNRIDPARPGPRPAHARDLEDLGYADAEIAALVDRGVVAAGLDPLPAATESVGAAEGSMPPR